MAQDNGKTYVLICKGECAAGFDRKQVIKQFAELFSVTLDHVEKLFSGEVRFEKRNLNYFTAKQYHDSFSKIGVISYLSPQDMEKDTGDDVPDQWAKKKNKDSRRARLGIRYGSIFILGIFILDEILQMRNVDIGFRPYLWSTVLFIYGCWHYARLKGYSSYIGGIFGIANMAGLIILFFLPDRTGATRKKGILKSILAIGIAVAVAIFWWDSYTIDQGIITDYAEYSKSIGIDRHVYPSDILDSEPEFLNKEFEKVTRLVDDGFELLNENEFRPGDIIYIGDIFLDQVASFFIWIQYQQYLHYTETGEIPDHLQSQKIKILNDAFQRQISAFVQNNKNLDSNEAFEKAYYAWIQNCLVWDLVSGKCLDTDYVCFGLDMQLEKIKQYFFEVEERERLDRYYEQHDYHPNRKYPQPPEANKKIISSIEVKNRSIVEIRIASEEMGEISGKLLVMVYYHQPTYLGREPLFERKFICIGGDVPNKYLTFDRSVFHRW